MRWFNRRTKYDEALQLQIEGENLAIAAQNALLLSMISAEVHAEQVQVRICELEIELDDTRFLHAGSADLLEQVSLPEDVRNDVQAAP